MCVIFKGGLETIVVAEEHGDKADFVRTTIYIHGMTCVSCVDTLETLFEELPGFVHSDATVSVTLLPQKVVAVYNPASVSERQLQKVITDAGFDVVLCNTEPLKKQKATIATVQMLISGMTFASTLISLITYADALHAPPLSKSLCEIFPPVFSKLE